MKINIDQKAAIQHLSQALQCETISVHAGEITHPEAFKQLHALLYSTYQALFKKAQVYQFGEFGLLLRWQGSDDALKPILLIAHQDVVPVPEAEVPHWEYPPFTGTVADGFISGRGALDMKGALIALLEAVNHLILNDFPLQRTLYIYLGDDEEVGGRSAKKAAEWMKSNKIHLDYILDEGGLILEKMLPQINTPICLIGICQKGNMNLELTVKGASGHSSKPLKKTPIDILAGAVLKLVHHELPLHHDALLFPLMKQLARQLPWKNRFIINNLWLFKSLLAKKLAHDPIMDAMLRTTIAPTIFKAGFKTNVVPEVATAIMNVRLYPKETPEYVVAYIERLLKHFKVEIKVLDVSAAPKSSAANTAAFKQIETSVKSIYEDNILVAPMLLIGSTDGRYFRDLANNLYHFLYMRGTREDFQGYHGINERISIDNFLNSINFYLHLISH